MISLPILFDRGKYGFSLYVLFACKVRIVLQIYGSLGETAARQRSLSSKDVILSIQIEFYHIIHECDCLSLGK